MTPTPGQPYGVQVECLQILWGASVLVWAEGSLLLTMMIVPIAARSKVEKQAEQRDVRVSDLGVRSALLYQLMTKERVSSPREAWGLVPQVVLRVSR